MGPYPIALERYNPRLQADNELQRPWLRPRLGVYVASPTVRGRCPLRLSRNSFCGTPPPPLNVAHHVTEPADADLRVTVSQQASRVYVWSFALFAVASAAFFVALFVQGLAGAEEVRWWEVAWGLAVAALFVGSGAFGAFVHSRPLVEEATVRDGSLTLIKSRYWTRRAFVGSVEDGLRVQVRDPFGAPSGEEQPGELLVSVPGRAASFGGLLPRTTLESLRDQIDAALVGAAEPTAAGRPRGSA